MALTRRSFVAGTAAVPLSLFLEKYAFAAGTFIRYDATSSQGKAMLKTYAKAVQKMRSAPITEGNPISWTFQWYTHQVKGLIQNAPQNKANEIARIYPTANAWKSLATEMWNTCQSHLGQPENNFLVWHRIYLWYFESIIRAVSGDTTFTLPYWNYTAPAPLHGVLPDEFRKPGDPAFGPLYVDKRNTGVNSGTPIDKGRPRPLNLSSLRECTYGPNGAQQGFNQAIDFGLHGDVHVYTGNTQNMGVVPWAAYDPIFYLHHCQIDRLWASWNAAGRKNPNFGTTKFVFANDKGQRVERLANDFLDLSKLDYKYDHLEPVTNPCPVSPAAAVSLKVATRTTPVPLGPGPVKMTMAAPPGPQAAVPLPTRVEKMSPNHRLYLVLRNLMTTGQPGVPYDLYLQVANGAATDDLYVGTINFFEFEHMHAGTPPADRFYSFDITDLAKRLQKAKKLTATPELTIVPGGKPAADAKPVIGEVSIVEQ